MACHGKPVYAMDFFLPWNLMGCHKCPWEVMVNQSLPWIFFLPWQHPFSAVYHESNGSVSVLKPRCSIGALSQRERETTSSQCHALSVPDKLFGSEDSIKGHTKLLNTGNDDDMMIFPDWSNP
jgi:hypothetical protein